MNVAKARHPFAWSQHRHLEAKMNKLKLIAPVILVVAGLLVVAVPSSDDNDARS